MEAAEKKTPTTARYTVLPGKVESGTGVGYNEEPYVWKHQSWHILFRGEQIGVIMLAADSRKTNKREKYEAKTMRRDGHIDSYLSSHASFYAAKLAIIQAHREAKHEPKRKPAEPVLRLLDHEDADFYPTPGALAGKMMQFVDFAKVQSILEPSAGKGDLAHAVIRAGKARSWRRFRTYDATFDLDCIEQDENLRHILTGKGYRVIADDFLTFTTHKHYDLIAMNPPFSCGDLHLLAAIEMQKNGGQIVCLLNAETLRNPCTNSRKLLSAMLDKYYANVRFIEGAFKRAERPSDVTVAIVYIEIPDKKDESEIYAKLHRAATERMDASQPTALIGGDYVSRLVTQYNIEAQASLAFFREYNGLVPYILSGDDEYASPLFTLRIDGSDVNGRVGSMTANRYMCCVRAKYWSKLFSIPQLTERFTSNLLDTYRNKIQDMREYDFSEYNIRQVLCELNVSLRQGVHAAIEELFDKLSAEHAYFPECKTIHYYNGWVTNKAHKINNKCIIPTYGCFADCRYSTPREPLDFYKCYALLSDLEKTLNYLDRGETPNVTLEHTLRAANTCGRTRDIPCKYFSVTFYKKGTCHIKFHEQRIVDVLNIYIGRKRSWLPPYYGKARYEDMDAKGRAIIDEFQGKEAYEAVMLEPERYLYETDAMPLLGMEAMGEEETTA